MGIHDNSLSAHKGIEGTLPQSRAEVLRVVRQFGPLTRQQVAARLGWAINRVTGRVLELIETGAVVEAGNDTSTGRARALLRVASTESRPVDAPLGGLRSVYIDVETYSEVDLTKVGTPVYAGHPSTECLLVSWAVGEGPVQTWDLTADLSPPAALEALVLDQGTLFHAWNAPFEMAIFREVLGFEVPVERWRCDMVHALSLSLPAALTQAGAAISLPQDTQKLLHGKKLIRTFCMPRKPTKARPWSRCTAETDPEGWAEFIEYNRQDVEAERAIHQRLVKWPLPEHELGYWYLDRKINDTGYPIDRELVDNARALAKGNRAELVVEAKALTGLANPNSVPQLMGWLKDRDLEQKNLDKHTVATLLQGELEPDVRRVLEIRQQLGKGSLAKFTALANATSDDDRLRNCLQFMGAARTGRWAGRVFQPHNIPRGSLKPEELHEAVEAIRMGYADLDMDQLASCIRSAVRAPEGQLLRVADLANIESRILGWISDCRRMLQVFASDEDIYKDFASELFRVAVARITKEQRNYAKPPTLGCGYGLGAKGLVAYAAGMFVEMTLEQAQQAVDAFRGAYPEVVTLWRNLERASMATVRDGKTREVGRLRFVLERPFLFMALPSGRRLAYLHPRVEKVEAPWGDVIDQVTYMGLDQYTRQWCRQSTFGGRWVEQACQAISRDLLAYGLAEADGMGFEVVGHTHDEIIALTDADDWRDHEVLADCMVRMPPWGDEKLFLDAEGFSEVIYRKD